MILLTNNKDATQSMLVGMDINDDKVLSFLFHNHVMRSFYSLIHINEINKQENLLVQQILGRYPTATCIARLSCPEGFVPPYEKKGI